MKWRLALVARGRLVEHDLALLKKLTIRQILGKAWVIKYEGPFGCLYYVGNKEAYDYCAKRRKQIIWLAAFVGGMVHDLGGVTFANLTWYQLTMAWGLVGEIASHKQQEAVSRA